MTYMPGAGSRARSATAIVLAAITLIACGGGDDEKPAQPPTSAVPAPPPAAPPAPPAQPSAVTPACTDCGAVNASTYAGTGVGVWQAINATKAQIDVPVRIDGLNGHEVTLVFTNQTARPQTMPTISLTTSSTSNVAASALQWKNGNRAFKQRLFDFNRDGWVALAGERREMSNGAAPHEPARAHAFQRAPSLSSVGDGRIWYYSNDNLERSATLVLTREAPDGTRVNFWVEDSENNDERVSLDIVTGLADSFTPVGRLYDTMTSIGGPFWGPHTYSEVIPGTGQPIDIVILNFDRDKRPYGMLGYFHARNALMRHAERNPYSNESVSLYLDAETLYLDGAEGAREMILTLAHEAMHMQNFYRRAVDRAPSYMFAQWLEEASAMMFEDFASHSIDAAYNPIRDLRFPGYIGDNGGAYNCSLTAFTMPSGACDSYSVSGSLGGFLTRQLGLDFYRNLLGNFSSTDSVAVLDAAIRSTQPSSDFGQQLRAFAATSGSLMRSPSPTGFGFPARVDGSFSLPSIDPRTLLPLRTLTQSVPQRLRAYGSLPIVRSAVSGTYSEIIPVPAGTSLSVVIQ